MWPSCRARFLWPREAHPALIGERALELRERLEASGYDTVGWSGADAVRIDWSRVDPARAGQGGADHQR